MSDSLTATNTFFQLEQVAEGVYFAQSIAGSGTQGNAAIVDLGDMTLIFDTFLTPPPAQKLRELAEQLTGRPASYVINSHFHADHVMGNQTFGAESIFVATSGTRDLMQQDAFLEEIKGLPNELQKMETELAETHDEVKRLSMLNNIGDFKAIIAATPTYQHVLPSLTFTDKLVFHGPSRSAELITYGGGHTGSDAFLYLPAERIAIMGDLVQVHHQPMFVHGDPTNWRSILDRVKMLDIQTILPGHGPLGKLEDIELIQQYLLTLEKLAQSALSEDRGLEDTLKITLPEPFASWEGQEVFGWNMEMLFARGRENQTA
jgi:glyoxylase-like metal-dependent hydrolase (beta-lactamase superfamily II)